MTDSVHARGGLISCQLFHPGRVAQPDIAMHPIVKDSGLTLPPVSFSATAIEARPEEGDDYNWDQPCTTPRALETRKIFRICEDYVHAGNNAKRAGFDSVELHAAHGYLIEQFLSDGLNSRSDQYGGSVENRCQILFEVADA